MLVDAEKAKEKLAKLCDDMLNTMPDGNVRDGIYKTRIDSVYGTAIRAADLSDCRVEVGEDNDPEWNSLHCTCGASGVPVMVHEPHCAVVLIESLSAQVAELTKEVERLRLPPEETLSAHPGCVFCMEAGTPVRPGQVCPKCGDRLPTREEYSLRAQVAELKKDAERYRAISCMTWEKLERIKNRTPRTLYAGGLTFDEAIDAAKEEK